MELYKKNSKLILMKSNTQSSMNETGDTCIEEPLTAPNASLMEDRDHANFLPHVTSAGAKENFYTRSKTANRASDIKKKKSKTETYKIYIYKVLKQVHPDP